jgi:hypothetical protein
LISRSGRSGRALTSGREVSKVKITPVDAVVPSLLVVKNR